MCSRISHVVITSNVIVCPLRCKLNGFVISAVKRLPGIVRHLAQGGHFVASVATFEDKDPNTGAVWHVTIRPFEWWHARFEAKGLRLERDVFNPRDFVRGSGNPRASDWDASVNPEMGFHITYKLP